MTVGIVRRLFCSLALLVALFLSPSARADGAHIALHATQSGYTVTLFTAPDPLVAGPVDFSLLVQDATTNAILTDTSAAGVLRLAGQPAVSFALSHASAQDKLLLAGNFALPQPGDYSLDLQVSQPGRAPVTFAIGSLPVAKNHGRLASVLWAICIPVILILLFLANQTAKQRLRAARQTGLERV